jgi:hypothetical protein
MREARRLSVGKVLLDGEDVSFEALPSRFEVRGGEEVDLMLLYEYREASDDEEHVRLVLTAELDGQKQGTDERDIRDRPMVVDDRRGFLSVPLKLNGAGERRGRFHVFARYAVGPWNAASQEEWILEREGEFTLVLSGPATHRV